MKPLTQSELMSSSLVLMVLGMAIVFLFLVILYLSTKLMSKAAEKKTGKGGSDETEALKKRIAELEEEVRTLRSGAASSAIPSHTSPIPRKAEPAAISTESSSPSTVTAPMPGKILRIVVKEGDRVERNSLVAVMEAMKMENEIFAPSSGIVKSIVASAGDSLNPGDKIMEIGSEGSAPISSASSPASAVEVPHEPPHPYEARTRRAAPAPARKATAASAHPGKAPSPRAAAAPSFTAPSPAKEGGTFEVRSPLAGKLIQLLVKKGDAVKKNQKILSIEAMKMENEVYSPADGAVTDVSVSEGAALQDGDLILTIASEA